MTLDLFILLIIILGVIIIFIFDILPPDITALSTSVILILTGLVTPEQGISGFSNQATITILALMILTIGLETNGAINWAGKKLKKLFSKDEKTTVFSLMSIISIFSAFINTTAVVVVFMRIMVKVADKISTSLSKLLIPLSFAGILGGSCSLLGTSTNILVSSISKEHGYGNFTLFEFSWIGAVALIAGIFYMVLIGRHLIPKRIIERHVESAYHLNGYYAKISISDSSDMIGKTLGESFLMSYEDIEILSKEPKNRVARIPLPEERIEVDDVLLVRGDFEKIMELEELQGVKFVQRVQHLDSNLEIGDTTMCQIVVNPSSRLVGQPLKKLDLKIGIKAIPLGVKKGRQYYHTAQKIIKIEIGDVILVQIPKVALPKLYNSLEYTVLEEHDELVVKSNKRYISGFILLGVILLAAFGFLDIMVSALLGCVVMFVTKCVNFKKVYKQVDWPVIFLLAGIIPLGVAMENTGADKIIATFFVEHFQNMQPIYFMAILFTSTTLLSAVMSNNATAILFAPIAISIAQGLNLDPKPFLLIVMFGANTSFFTPIGYQTNALIYSVGQYRFKDFVVVGGWLTLIAGSITISLISWHYY